MRRIPAAIAVLVLTLQASTEVGGQESDALPPEMKALEKLVGTWKVEQMTRVPEEFRSTYTLKGELVLGGRFIQQMGATDEKKKSTQMGLYTYDSNTKHYRYWFFMSSGFFTDFSGTWDESSQTLTFTNRLPGGGTGTITQRFPDKTTFVFSMTTKDAGGQVVYQMEGKAVRQK